jgi:hypothetical protein
MSNNKQATLPAQRLIGEPGQVAHGINKPSQTALNPKPASRAGLTQTPRKWNNPRNSGTPEFKISRDRLPATNLNSLCEIKLQALRANPSSSSGPPKIAPEIRNSKRQIGKFLSGASFKLFLKKPYLKKPSPSSLFATRFILRVHSCPAPSTPILTTSQQRQSCLPFFP